MTVSLSASILKSMSKEDRVEECYFAIMDLLENYGCEFVVSVTKHSNGDENWNINVKLKDEAPKPTEGDA